MLYVIAELNKPQPIDWTVTLSKNDKNPYGGYILHKQLKNIFPGSSISSFQKPVYNQLNNIRQQNTAYIILSPVFSPSKNDVEEMRNYVRQGNYVLIAAANFSKPFLDTFKLKIGTRISLINKDSTSLNFVNTSLKEKNNYTFLSSTIDEYFTKVDTSATTILGINDRKQPNYIKVNYGTGAFFIHTAPVSFSNYFMLYQNNASYTAKALSYIPKNVQLIRWDEYYKPGNTGPETPLRFFLQNEYLKWALRLALLGLLIYIVFEMKRKQRVIPTILPARNSTLDFVTTVSNVYFNQRDNHGIADKKINYFMDYIRHRFFLPTTDLDPHFEEQLVRKSGVNKTQVAQLLQLIKKAKQGSCNDQLLIELDTQIDHFYKQI